MSPVQNVRIGVAAVIRRGDEVLMGRRIGSHGAGTWSFPGGHLEWNETPAGCASREGEEESGLIIPPGAFRKLTFTNDVFTVDDKHYVTLYMEADWVSGEPRIMEPTKCAEWKWCRSAPDPLFLPIQNLLKDEGYSLIWRA